jgi:flavin-dependent dehydrogenase
MGALYQRWLADCLAAGAQWLPGASYLNSEPAGTGSLVHLKRESTRETVQARYLVAADGTNSRVARDLNLSVNRHWIVGLEAVYDGAALSGPPRLHCFLDARVAPGYIAWVAEDGHSVHVGVGGYSERFQPAAALERFSASLGGLVSLDAATLVERRGGRIPVGGILSNLANTRALLLGDAAGAASPLTAGGLDPCLRLSELAAKVIWQYLQTSDPAWLAHYDGRQLGRRFRTRKALRTALRWLGSNALFEMACAAMRTRSGRKLAEKIFFGRGSFPDVDRLALPRAGSQASALKAQQPQAVAMDQGL